MMDNSVIYIRIAITIAILLTGLVFPKSKIIFVIQATWLVVLSSFNTLSADWSGNEGLYNLTTSAKNVYGMLAVFFHSQNASFVVFNGALTFIATLLILYIILKYSANPNMVLSLWYIFPLVDNIVQKRAYYALGIQIVAIALLFDKNHRIRNFVIFEILMLIAYQIHTMSIYYMTLPIFLLLNRKWQKRCVIAIIIAGFIFRNGLQGLVGPIINNDEKTDLYFNTLAQTSTIAHTLFWSVWQIAQLAIIKYINKEKVTNERQEIIEDINWWGLTLIPFYSFNPVFTRVFRAVMLYNDVMITNDYRKKGFLIGKTGAMVVALQISFLLVSFYAFDMARSTTDMIVFPIFANNWILK
ncbi:EpsG family protein [Limosilactobacillus fermentum]|uniref:EpsG family protein n=2 Tax=Limosilactobacillus fermentum TaxID=1613 RepID=UPI002F263DFC